MSTAKKCITTMTLKQWLKLMNGQPSSKPFINYMFPSEEIKNEYLDSIEKRTDEEIMNLLSHFLITSGSLGTDNSQFDTLLYFSESNPERFEYLLSFQYNKRLFSSHRTVKKE